MLNSSTVTYNYEALTDDLSPYSDYDIVIIIATRGNGSFSVSVSNCNIIADFVTAYDAQHVFVISGITSNSILSGYGYGTASYTRVIIGLR